MQVNFHQYAVSHYFTTAIFAVYAVGTFQIPLVDLVASSAGSVMMVRMTEKVRGQDEAVLAIWHSTISKLALVLFPVVGWALVLITRTGDQVAPKSVVRENSVTSVNALEWRSASMLALGPSRASQTA